MTVVHNMFVKYTLCSVAEQLSRPPIVAAHAQTNLMKQFYNDGNVIVPSVHVRS